MSDIFLSYSSADRDRVAPIAAALERLGWRVWWDRRILAGQSWDDVIAKALEAARCIVVIWTQASVSSQWVRIEANIGRERGILAPVLIDDVPIPLTFRHIQSASLVGWDGTADSTQFEFLANGIKGVLFQEGPPLPQAVVPEPITEGRALDAAMAGELPIHEPTSLIAMVRCPDSNGLKAILDADDEYSLSSEDVVSKPFDLTFPVDAHGRIAYAEILLRVQCPDFAPPAQEKKIRVSRNRDSTVCSFLLTPITSGKLSVQLEIYQQETCVASRLLRSNCVPSDRTGPAGAHRVVTMPLYINVMADEFTRIFGALPPAGGPKPAAGISATLENKSSFFKNAATLFVGKEVSLSLGRSEEVGQRLPAVSPPSPATSRPSGSGGGKKAAVAAAMIALCLPAIFYRQWYIHSPSPSIAEHGPLRRIVIGTEAAPSKETPSTAQPKPYRPALTAPAVDPPAPSRDMGTSASTPDPGAGLPSLRQPALVPDNVPPLPARDSQTQPAVPGRPQTVPLPPPPNAPPGYSLKVFSRDEAKHPIDNGISFAFKDPELGEMGAGDLKVHVVLNGPSLDKGPLTIEWKVDGTTMDGHLVNPNTISEFGNEPTPGSYRVVLRQGVNTVAEYTFRITR